MKEIATPNQSKTVVTRKRKFQITRGDIVRYFKINGIDVPANVSMTITVPRGGDYSGTKLNIGWGDEIDNEAVIDVEWTETRKIDRGRDDENKKSDNQTAGWFNVIHPKKKKKIDQGKMS